LQTCTAYLGFYALGAFGKQVSVYLQNISSDAVHAYLSPNSTWTINVVHVLTRQVENGLYLLTYLFSYQNNFGDRAEPRSGTICCQSSDNRTSCTVNSDNHWRRF